MKKKFLLLLALCTATLPAHAHNLPIFTLPDVVIYASAENVDTVINVQQVNIGAAQTVPELLRNTAGIQIQARPNAGGNEDLTVKLRGHDSRHYTVLMDGIPQSMSGVMGGGYVNWNAIPLGMVERIEIIKGAKSAAYGQSEGGVINIITKKSADAGELQLTTGNNDRRQYIFNYGVQIEALGFRVYANKSEQDAYLRNSDYDNEQTGINLNYKLSQTDSLRFNYDHQQLKRGLVIANAPGNGNYDSRYPISSGDTFANSSNTPGDGSYTKIYRNNFNVTWNSDRDNGSDSLTYWKNHEKQREHNVENGNLIFDRYNVTDKSIGLMYKGSAYLSSKHQLGYGADYKRLRYGYGWYNSGNGNSLYPSQKLDVWGIYIEDNWHMDERWLTNIGLRYDKMEGDRDAAQATNIGSMSESALSPKLNVHFKNDERTSTNFSVNRIWRAPSMAEFYWHYSGFGFAKSLLLAPEKGWGYEASIAHQFNDKLHSKATAFYQDISDYINFTHQRPFNAYNIDKAQLWGCELENTWKLDDASIIFLNYTNMHTKKEGVHANDNVGLHGELDYRPRHTLALGYQYDEGKWHARYDMTYTSSQKATLGYPATDPATYKVQEIGGYVVHNLSATYDFAKNSSVNFSLYNIFDKEYCEIYGYPMEGRVFTATFTYKF
ncbi:MAG: TonB-dependent receptor [Phascolarctobacterium sp.]|nr:TonB-dependent receptor [Phascolarctobacterium sp.]MBO5404161.1 TonB-dependent receptor [Phascolarctobacterium sp.]